MRIQWNEWNFLFRFLPILSDRIQVFFWYFYILYKLTRLLKDSSSFWRYDIVLINDPFHSGPWPGMEKKTQGWTCRRATSPDHVTRNTIRSPGESSRTNWPISWFWFWFLVVSATTTTAIIHFFMKAKKSRQQWVSFANERFTTGIHKRTRHVFVPVRTVSKRHMWHVSHRYFAEKGKITGFTWSVR